ncbi:GNAT family N-acetyltransferase [Pannonibacter carbonis]|uniref:GNAT family N-acetyltransferase n=1 Tax=Pannonibacter carbonis TaxID=2067569 RepID=UPI000D10BE86|nr:GNAT family N-acetyltransferase [Pannonibacter carbonis]
MTFTARLCPIAENDGWNQLYAEALEPNPFFGPGFLLPYATHLKRGQLRLVVVKDAETGRWLMAAPVGRTRAGFLVPTATLWASEYGPLGTPLVHPQCPADAIPGFLETAASVSTLPGASTLDIPFLPLDGPVARLLRQGANGWTVSQGPAEDRAAHSAGAEGAQQLAEVMTGKRRKEYDRLARRLQELGDVREDSYRGAAALSAFEEFLTLEAAGWKGRAGTALASNGQVAAFAHSFVAALAKADALRVEALRLDGRPIALLAMAEHGGRAYAWKITHDEELARFSPGQRITLQALRTGVNDARLIGGGDSLAIPDHPMINPLWRGRMAYATLRFTRGPLAAPIAAVQAADNFAFKVARRLYHRLKRR